MTCDLFALWCMIFSAEVLYTLLVGQAIEWAHEQYGRWRTRRAWRRMLDDMRRRV